MDNGDFSCELPDIPTARYGARCPEHQLRLYRPSPPPPPCLLGERLAPFAVAGVGVERPHQHSPRAGQNLGPIVA